jgi:hypothetical protein
VRRYALNANPSEGDLTTAPPQTLLARLEPIPIKLRKADDFTYDLIDQAGYNRSLLLMALLVALLLAEQALAYSASYHAAPGGARG